MTTATLETIDADDLETCDDCGRQCNSTDGGLCGLCAAAESARQELIDAAQVELIDAAQAEVCEADDELEAALADLAAAQERVKNARREVREANRALAKCS